MSKVEKLALLYQLNVLRRIERLSTSAYLTHFRKWLTQQRTKSLNGNYENVSDCARLARLNSKKLKTEIDDTKKLLLHTGCAKISLLLSRLAASAEAIFKGVENADDILKQDGHFNDLGSFLSGKNDFSVLLSSMAHTNPTMRVLELGTGFTNTTAATVKALVNSAS